MTVAVKVPEAGFGLREASKISGIPRTSFYALVKQGKIDTYKGVDGRLKVRPIDLAVFLNERQQQD